ASIPGAEALATHRRACEVTSMDATIALYPTSEQIQELVASPADGPVVMLNLLRFKPQAGAPDEGTSGEEAYRRYADPMIAYVRSKGARVVWMGRVTSQVVGTGGEGFHMIALVEYPSRAAFFEITGGPHVHDIGVHRAAGLEG